MPSSRIPALLLVLAALAGCWTARAAVSAEPIPAAVLLYDGKLPAHVTLEAAVRKLVEPFTAKVELRTMHAGRAETTPFLQRHGFTRKNAPLLLLMDGRGDAAKVRRKVYVDPAYDEKKTARLVLSVLKLPMPPAEHPKPGPVVTVVPDGGAAETKLLSSAVGTQRVTPTGRWLEASGMLIYRLKIPDELRYADLHAEVGGNFTIEWAESAKGPWTPLMDSHRYFGAASDAITTRVSPSVSLDALVTRLASDLFVRVRTNGRGRNRVYFARLEVVARSPQSDSAESAWLREAERMRDEQLAILAPGKLPHTPLGGILATNLQLSADKSPYLLTGDLTVNPNVTLTVEPGVTIRVAGNAAIRVRGQLVAKGTAKEPILFGPSVARQPDDWKGIAFAPLPTRPSGSSSVMDYCRVVNAAAVDLPQFAGEISHSIFEGGLAGIVLRGGGTGKIHHNRFLRCIQGLVVEGGTGDVTDNEWLECQIATGFSNLSTGTPLRFEQNSFVRARLAAVNYLKVPGKTMPTLNLPNNYWAGTPDEKVIGGGPDAGPVMLEPKLTMAPVGAGPGWGQP